VPLSANRLLAVACVSLVACTFLAGCSNVKVPKPASDSTPPSLVWNVYDHETGAQADHPGSPTLQAERGDRYRVMLKAQDPQGVQSIQLNPAAGGGEVSWTCADLPGPPNLQQDKNLLLGPQTQNLAPDANGYVLTSIFLIQELDFSLSCQQAWIFASGTAKLTGRATNYFGGATTETIIFSIAP
jgi:hypothetical protein